MRTFAGHVGYDTVQRSQSNASPTSAVASVATRLQTRKGDKFSSFQSRVRSLNYLWANLVHNNIISAIKSGLRRVRNARMFIWRPNFEMITSQNVVDTIQMRYAGARG